MRRVFEMEDLDCANCAAKMEDAIRKIEGVAAVRVLFIQQRIPVRIDRQQYGIDVHLIAEHRKCFTVTGQDIDLRLMLSELLGQFTDRPAENPAVADLVIKYHHDILRFQVFHFPDSFTI